jgi:F420-dependent oxidoreductase-like protein
MDLNIHLSNLTWPGGPAALAPTLAATARAADEGGVTTLTLMDHWFQMESIGGPDEPMLEGYTTLGYLAAATERLELGLLVTGVTYRHPGLLAKIVATLDVLSGGRAMLGLGAAWYEQEHLGLGVPFPPLAERFERLEEALQICRQMWSDDRGPYQGRHYQLAETLSNPAPLHRPRIVIGGTGEKKTLRFVARYADACNLFATSPDEVAHKIEVLTRHCETEQRDPATIKKTIIGAFDPLDDLDGFLKAMEQYAAVGVDTIWIGPSGPDPASWTLRVGDEVIPRLSEIVTGTTHN